MAERKRPSFKISQKLEKDCKNSDYLLKRAFIYATQENLVTEPLEDLNHFFSMGNKSIDGYRLRASLLLKRNEWMKACGDLLNVTQLFKRKTQVHNYITKRCYKQVSCYVCSEKFSFNDEAKVCTHCKITLHDGLCREKYEKSILSMVYHLRGITRYHHEDYEKACKDITKAIGFCDDERMKIVYVGDRGLVFYYMGKLEESLVDLETSLAQNPTHEYFPRMISAAYFRLNKIPEAKIAFSRAQENSPSFNITPEEFFPYDLPDKILQEIFYHLSEKKDRVQFICTCRKWYGVLLRLQQVFQKNTPEGTRTPDRRQSRRSTYNNNNNRVSRDDIINLDFNKSLWSSSKVSPISSPVSPGSPTEETHVQQHSDRITRVQRSKTSWNVELDKPSFSRKSRSIVLRSGDDVVKGEEVKRTGDELEKTDKENNGTNNVVEETEFQLPPVLSISPAENDKKKIRRSSKTPRDDKTTDMAGSRRSDSNPNCKSEGDVNPSDTEVVEVGESFSPISKRKVITKLRAQSRSGSPKVRRTKTRDLTPLSKNKLRVESDS